MKLQALKKRCIIEQVKTEQVNPSGLIVNTHDNNPRARIVSVGSEVTEVQVGDVVVVDWRYVVQVTKDEPKYYTTEEGNIQAVEVSNV